MMEKLNAKRDAEAQQTVEEFMQTPENQKKIDDIVKQRVAELKAGSEGNVTVFEDEIRKQVERDFINHYTQMYNNEGSTKADRELDEEVARRAAANAYMVDATIEEIRMAAVNFAFKKYLFDKGTLKALGDDLNYSNVTAAEDGTLTTTRQGLERAKAVIKPVWGGFESNYFDDVTVGFGKGFGLGQYNAYLQNKYDASKAAETSGYTLSFIDGLDSALTGASEALFDRQSFYDGFVGALGTPLSIMPRLGRGDRAQALEGMNRTDATSLTFGEKINKWFMNPLLEAYYNERGKQERTNEILPYVNRAITKDKDALENINQMVIGLKDMSVSDISGSVLQRKDAKDRQAFRLLYVMNGMDTAPLIQESPIVANAAQVIDRMADGNITDQEVHDFLNQPGNKDIQQQENPEQIARDRIQKNAKTLQDMSRKIADSRELIENSILGRNIDKDLKEQLVFNIAMGKTWEERLADMQETLTGNRQINTAHNAVAAYGNKEEYQRQKDA